MDRTPSEADTTSSSADEPPLPKVIAERYYVEQRLTRGGMGEILRVVDTVRRRRVALKRLLETAASKPKALMLFEREYHTLASLKHPRIVEVYDYGIAGVPYYTMELLDGRDLTQLAPMPYRDACRYLRDVASSLALLHARHLLHRDVSPRNVRITADGRCKLLDFGALTSFGVPDEIVGTPPGTPPEALYSVPLDQRVDLFAVGALGYWLLTSRHAYPARNFADLQRAWASTVLPPSAFAEVPEELEQLILSLISQNPVERPTTAAEVINRLNAIAGLEPEDDNATVQSYLVTPRLVGRGVQLQELNTSLEKAANGAGSAFFIEAPNGMGKTRLLDELTLAARLAGMVAVRVNGELHTGPFGVATAFAEGLVRQAPSDARRASAEDLALLGSLSPTLHESLSVEQPIDVIESPGERRAQIQVALSKWVATFSKERAIAVFVDNAQSADQGSVGFLLGLATEAARGRLLLVTAARPERSAAAADALQKLREASECLNLPPLTARDVDDLAESLFGNVPNLSRFAQWIHRNAAGNPRQCIELARYAVTKKIARYVEGSWALPEELSAEAIASGFKAMLEWSLGQLTPEARHLAEALSVHDGPLDLEVCAVLAGDLTKSGQLFSALDELVSKGILTSDAGGFRFSQASVRNRLVGKLDPDRKKRLHRSLAEALLSNHVEDFKVSMEAGFHLIHAGEQTRGADLLARAALGGHSVAIVDGDLHAAIPALEAALSVYRAQKRPLAQQAPLLATLVTAAYYVDWKLARRYGDEAVSVLGRLLGLSLARKLRPVLGRKLSLAFGIFIAVVRFGFTRNKPISFKDVFVATLSSVTQLVGISVSCLETDDARRYADVLEPFRVLRGKLAPVGICEYCTNLTLFAENRLAEARVAFVDLLERLKDEDYYRSLRPESRDLFIGGALYVLGVLESFRDTGEVIRYANELESLGSKFYRMVVCRLRIAHHAYRGEMDLITRYRERLDVYAIQYGSAWQVEMWAPAAMLTAYSNVGDVIGVKLAADRLANIPAEMVRLRRLARLAEGTHALLGGNASRAVEILEELRDAGHFTNYPGCTSSWGTLATAYNYTGQYDKAKAVCETILANLSDADREFVIFTLKLELQLALAEAGLGDLDGAAARLDALLAKYEGDRGPVTLARLHQTRARVALLSGDTAQLERHLEAMGQIAQATNNSSLISQWKRMARRMTRMRDGGEDAALASGIRNVDGPASCASEDPDDAMTQTSIAPPPPETNQRVSRA